MDTKRDGGCIGDATGRLSERLDQVEKAVAALASRASPVLRPESDRPAIVGMNKDIAGQPRSDLRGIIDVQADRALQIAASIDALASRFDT